MTASKSADKSPTPGIPEKVPQPHGGALYRGGVPGNRGNPTNIGRPPSVIRDRLRGSFDERVRILEEIADTAEIEPADRMKAIDLMGKYGLGSVKGVSDEEVREKLRATLEIIMAELPADVAEPLLGKIETVWR